MTASLKIIAILISVTLMVITGIMISPMVKIFSDKASSASDNPLNAVVALYQTVQNDIANEFAAKVVDSKNAQRVAVEQKLLTKGYSERFLNLLNDHSILSLARKEGLTVKDWRI